MDRKKTFRAHVTDKGYYLIYRPQIGKNYQYQLTLKTKIWKISNIMNLSKIRISLPWNYNFKNFIIPSISENMRK